jgi:S-adenosylmethionine:tRNA ribosyltransferase-isomerase
MPGACEALPARGTEPGLWTGPFDYELPPELIAQRPAARRDQARLLVLCRRSGRIDHSTVAELAGFLRRGDLVVANDSRVVAARLIGRKPTGGKVELLVLALEPPGAIPAMMRSGRSLRVGDRIELEGGYACRIAAIPEPGRCLLDLGEIAVRDVLGAVGRVPLPPYIRRGGLADDADRSRYQTIYARVDGSVAAPTAGLHLTERSLESLHARDIGFATITLHVGPGTFQPVRARFEDHRMEAESYSLTSAVAGQIARTRAAGGRIVAVGTTTVRAIESASERTGNVEHGHGQARLFIRPGHRFRAIDALLTNFHLPRSTLLALVSAFAGEEAIRAAYRAAVAERYRFYSYGDAMLIT